MAFEYSDIESNSTKIHLLKYDEFDPFAHLDKLTGLERERLSTFSHIKRQREFVATRLLRHELFGYEHIHYDAHGAPFIEQEGYISISHSTNQVGIAVNSNYQVGLDLEPHRSNILSLAHKFLSHEERLSFDCTNPVTVTKIWSCKEALYKLAGRKKIIFKDDLVVGDNWNCLIDNYDHKLKVKMDIFDIDETIISINASKFERID